MFESRIFTASPNAGTDRAISISTGTDGVIPLKKMFMFVMKLIGIVVSYLPKQFIINIGFQFYKQLTKFFIVHTNHDACRKLEVGFLSVDL